MVVLCCVSSPSHEARSPNWEALQFWLFNETLPLCSLFVLSILPCVTRRRLLHQSAWPVGSFDEVRRLRGIFDFDRFCRACKNMRKFDTFGILQFCQLRPHVIRSSSTIFYECMFEWVANPNPHCQDNWNVRVVNINRMSVVFRSFKKCIPGLSCPFTVLGRLFVLGVMFHLPCSEASYFFFWSRTSWPL